MLSKFTTRRGPVLATNAGEVSECVRERRSERLGKDSFGSPLAELAIGVVMMILALPIAWAIAEYAADVPPQDARQAAGAEACVGTCALDGVASTTARDEAVLSEDWRWGTGDYSFDEIYGQSQMPAAYSYDFVYPRPMIGFSAR